MDPDDRNLQEVHGDDSMMIAMSFSSLIRFRFFFSCNKNSIDAVNIPFQAEPFACTLPVPDNIYVCVYGIKTIFVQNS